MTIGEWLIDIMIKDGVSISQDEKYKAILSIDKAVRDKKIYMIEKDNSTIGFATYKEKSDGIFLNYCFIYKKFRGKNNLLGMRKFFREKSKNFIWRSRRRNRLCFVR